MAGDAVTVAVIAAVAGLLGGAGGAGMIKALTSRKPRSAVAVESDVTLAEASQRYAATLEEDARQARVEVREAREGASAAWQKANDAERKAHVVSQEVEEVKYNLAIVSRYVLWLLELIGEPTMNIDRLRAEINDRRPPVTVGGQQ